MLIAENTWDFEEGILQCPVSRLNSASKSINLFSAIFSLQYGSFGMPAQGKDNISQRNERASYFELGMQCSEKKSNSAYYSFYTQLHHRHHPNHGHSMGLLTISHREVNQESKIMLLIFNGKRRTGEASSCCTFFSPIKNPIFYFMVSLHQISWRIIILQHTIFSKEQKTETDAESNSVSDCCGKSERKNIPIHPKFEDPNMKNMNTCTSDVMAAKQPNGGNPDKTNARLHPLLSNDIGSFNDPFSAFQFPFEDLRLEPRPFPPSSSSPPMQENVLSMDALFVRAFVASSNDPQGEDLSAQERPCSSRKRTGSRTMVDEQTGPSPKKQKKNVEIREDEQNDEARRAALSKVRHVTSLNDILWQEQYQKLLYFKANHGHCSVPINYSQDIILARWVKRQRYQYKRKLEGKTCALDNVRIELLERLGFVWDSHANSWQEKYHRLAAYKRTHGDFNVRRSSQTNIQLLTWMKGQRRQYKLYTSGRPSTLTMERIQALNSLGFLWSAVRNGTTKNDDESIHTV
eukprot:scaffold1228_cov119-Cylindrotheca_fusiformis.AAC.12